MKQKALILVAVFTVSLIAGLLFRRVRHTETVKPTEIATILKCIGPRVDQVQLSRSTGAEKPEELYFRKFTPPGMASEAIAQLFAEWKMEKPHDAEANTNLLNTIVSTLCESNRDTPYTESSDLKELGIEQGRLEIRFYEGQQEWKVRIGKKPGSNNLIVAVPNRTHWDLFMISNKLELLLNAPVEDFQNRLPLKMNIDNADLIRVSAGGKERFSLERENEGWNTMDGKQVVARASEEGEKYANRLSTLQALDWQSTEYAASDCKKLKAKFVVNVEGIGGKKEELRFSAPQYVAGEKDKRILACSSERSALFLVHPDMEKYLSYSAKDFAQTKKAP